MKVMSGFCKRLATGRCYRGIYTGHFKDYGRSTGSNPCLDKIRNPDGIQPRFVVANNADLIECGLDTDGVARCSRSEMMGAIESGLCSSVLLTQLDLYT